MSFIVELEKMCYLAPWNGDPGRTIFRCNAREYKTERGAKIALGISKKYRVFDNPRILNTKEGE